MNPLSYRTFRSWLLLPLLQPSLPPAGLSPAETPAEQWQAPARPTGAWELSVRVFSGITVLGNHETGAALELSFPLEKLVPASWVAGSDDKTNGSSGSEPSPKNGKDATNSKAGSRVKESPKKSGTQPAKLTVTRSLARACVQQAWRAHHLDTPRRFQSMMTRARYSALLPRTTVRWARGWDQSFRLSPTRDDPYRLQETNGGRQWFEARATWDLDRLVFAGEEIPVQRMIAAWRKRRAELAAKVLEELSTWQRAMIASNDQNLDAEQRLAARIEQTMCEVRLDILTAGWFGRWLDAHGSILQTTPSKAK